MPESLVIIPTYNEIENVERIIRKVLSLEDNFHILIVDDNSPDGTSQKVAELQQEFPDRLNLECRHGKQGLGTAYIHGFKWALNKKYDYIFEMDCDFSHNPDDLPRLLNALKGTKYSLSIGSRYCKGGKVKNWPMNRILMSYFASIYVRMILWLPVKDTTAGFMCYKNEVLSTIDLDKVTFRGYAFQICLKYAAYRHKFKIIEVPITFVDRLYGESKMSSGIFKEAFFGVWKMRNMKL